MKTPRSATPPFKPHTPSYVASHNKFGVQVYRDLSTGEDLSRTKTAGAVDMKVFGALVGSVNIYAIDQLRTERE